MDGQIADSMEQSLFEQHFPRRFHVRVAFITCMAAPHLCLSGLGLELARLRAWGGPGNERKD